MPSSNLPLFSFLVLRRLRGAMLPERPPRSLMIVPCGRRARRTASRAKS
ncbi:MAG: hypothetical protein AB1656_25955 [Candidatus Omnitrophota bacterium]